MHQDHEYSVIGHSRASVGRHLGTVAAALASGAVLLFGFLVGLADWLGLPDIPPIVLWPITAGVTFSAVHWAFNRYVWRWSRVLAWLRIPDLNGEWKVVGKSLNMEKDILHEWKGVITITQTWEKIWVNLRTGQSASNSEAAALIREPAGSFRLMYRYRNEPKIDEVDLSAHVGFAELLFASNLGSAEGDYFNSKGRYTFGTMRLTRRA